MNVFSGGDGDSKAQSWQNVCGPQIRSVVVAGTTSPTRLVAELSDVKLRLPLKG